MKQHIADFIHKTLTSRKFWAAVAASVPFAQAGDWNSFAYVWMGYAGIQGAVDASERVGTGKETAKLKVGSAEVDPAVVASAAEKVLEVIKEQQAKAAPEPAPAVAPPVVAPEPIAVDTGERPLPPGKVAAETSPEGP